jgi:hypothetical protein
MIYNPQITDMAAKVQINMINTKVFLGFGHKDIRGFRHKDIFLLDIKT